MAVSPRICALIVAAGEGRRVGGDVPKQYRSIAGVPVLARTIGAIRAGAPDADIVVVINPLHRDLYDAATVGLGLAEPVSGGQTRAESVARGLAALASANPDIVLIQDAARPFVSAALVHQLISAVTSDADGALPGLRVSDSLKRTGSDDQVVADVARQNLWTVQTPQVFRFEAIAEAFRSHFDAHATDDVAIARAAGLKITMVEGERGNIKLTHESDFSDAQMRFEENMTDVRVGSGFDVHGFADGDHVMLCGVRVPHDRALLGHSDADVGMHALTDAILGAIGAGDIGVHFPPSNPDFRGASSDRFLRYAVELVAARGGAIAHCDVTIICESPKIGPHRESMIARLSAITRLEADRISIKATTTEGLGFTGRREGVAAMATATVRLPL